MTAQPNRRQKLKHEHPLPVKFILCLSYAFLVFMLCHGIQFHLLQLNRYVASNISCAYHVLTLCLSCVAFSRQSDIPKILHMTVRPLPYPLPDMKIRPQGFTKQDKHGSYVAEFILCLPCAFHVPMLCLSCAEFDKSTPLPRVTIMLQ